MDEAEYALVTAISAYWRNRHAFGTWSEADVAFVRAVTAYSSAQRGEHAVPAAGNNVGSSLLSLHGNAAAWSILTPPSRDTLGEEEEKKEEEGVEEAEEGDDDEGEAVEKGEESPGLVAESTSPQIQITLATATAASPSSRRKKCSVVKTAGVGEDYRLLPPGPERHRSRKREYYRRRHSEAEEGVRALPVSMTTEHRREKAWIRRWKARREREQKREREGGRDDGDGTGDT
ncbi:hypothetical protein BAUCODRAFT_28901 [Baudoinia panamericana UAMH 10762]|uniref:Uncharacterized protein n=1 Tax=Baudoinia panamericana (strain UAMH 10762) TaxID=717646 RepID=M2MUF9_BAUPA|nr:uncharacterized protein BAUCODRAFT_28901 [Baudoinia panamericana UAMH 10762]EMD00552.1 hypothetical protein BAUCODRAFT_28901 [Baudoinia panamericana UAMH 10762]